MFRRETFGKYRISSLCTCHWPNVIIAKSRRQEEVSNNLLLDLRSFRAAKGGRIKIILLSCLSQPDALEYRALCRY